MWSAAFLQFNTQRDYSQFLEYIQSCWYFRPSFVTFTLPLCLSPHLSGSPVPLTPFPMWISVQIKSCRKVAFQVTFRWRHFAFPSVSLIFLWLHPSTISWRSENGYPSFLLSSYFFSMCGTHCRCFCFNNYMMEIAEEENTGYVVIKYLKNKAGSSLLILFLVPDQVFLNSDCRAESKPGSMLQFPSLECVILLSACLFAHSSFVTIDC